MQQIIAHEIIVIFFFIFTQKHYNNIYFAPNLNYPQLNFSMMAEKGGTNKKIIIIMVIILILLSTLFIYLYFSSDEPEESSNYEWKRIFLNQTKIDDGYTLRIIWKTHHIFSPKDCMWSISNYYGIAHNSFPIISGNSGSTSDNNITVTWFDNDLDKKLSINDTIKIYAPQHNLSQKYFILDKLIYDNGSIKRFDLFSQILLK